MSNTLTIGKRLVPLEHVAFLEPFEPRENSTFHPTRGFQARLVLLNRDSILMEEAVEAFAARHGFALLADDRVAVNPLIRFAVETFVSAQGFTPSRPFASRLKWRDADGNDQSKLLLTAPETVLAVAVTGGEKADAAPAGAPGTRRTATPRRRRMRTAPGASM